MANVQYFEQIVMIIYLIVLGLGIVQHISNIGHIIPIRKKTRHNVRLWVWVVIIFIIQIQMAEHAYGFKYYNDWSNRYVLLVLANPLCLYVVVSLLLPRIEAGQISVDLNAHFDENKKIIFTALTVLTGINILTSIVFQPALGLDNSYIIAMILFAILFISMAIINNRFFLTVATLFSSIGFIVFSILFSSNYADCTNFETDTFMEKECEKSIGSDSIETYTTSATGR